MGIRSNSCKNMKEDGVLFDEMETYMLALLRYGVLDEKPLVLQPSSQVDWDRMMDVASAQGLLAWVWDGICKLPKEFHPPRQQAINWGLSAQETWDRYAKQKRVLMQMVDICHQNNIRLLLFKGIALSELFLRPESRPSGDIDIYLFEDYSRGDELFAHSNVTRTNKRTGFDYEGVHIENHRIFLNTYTKLQVNAINYLETTLDSAVLTKDGYYIMSPIACIVYQVMHFIAHFDDASASLSLKFVVDFGITLNSYSKEINTSDLYGALSQLDIVGVFDLMLTMVEEIMALRFDEYRYKNIPQEDVVSVFQLIMSREKNFVPLIERNFRSRVAFYYLRFRQFDNLYKYLPVSRLKFAMKATKELLSISVRRMFHMSDRGSYFAAIKMQILGK